jgi:type IV secretion system protein VirB1
MQIVGPALVYLMANCAPLVHWETMSAMIYVESRGHAYAINDNFARRSYRPKTIDEAVATAQKLIAEGRSIDMGLVQINSNNLGMLRMSVREVFDPCRNLQASQAILLGNYQRALAQGHAWGQPALQAALSAYNTGSMMRGREYVQRVLHAAGSTFPLQSFLAPRPATATSAPYRAR